VNVSRPTSSVAFSLAGEGDRVIHFELLPV
jgi:hypothetical protein